MKSIIYSVVEFFTSYFLIRIAIVLAFETRFQLTLRHSSAGPFAYYLILILNSLISYLLNKKIYHSTPKILAWLFPALFLLITLL